MRSTNNTRWEQWKPCQRCGLDRPLSMLAYDRNPVSGSLIYVCTDKCLDKPAVLITQGGAQPVMPTVMRVPDTRGGYDDDGI